MCVRDKIKRNAKARLCKSANLNSIDSQQVSDWEVYVQMHVSRVSTRYTWLPTDVCMHALKPLNGGERPAALQD